MARNDTRGTSASTGKTASLLALAAGLATTLSCVAVIYRTAQLPAGDGSGMQWIVLTPLALLFFLAGVPALIVGTSGLRSRHSPEAARRERQRAFKLLFGFLAAVLVILFLARLVVGLLLGEV